MQHRAIETRYKGYRFRSRLEARWAVFFDALGLRWEYEPEGFELPSGRYLPDFFVHTPWMEFGARVEIKPTQPTPLELKLLKEASEETLNGYLWKFGVFLIGTPGVHRSIQLEPGKPAVESDGGLPLVLEMCRKGGLVRLDELQRAVEAARSARFEHGESGAR